MKYLIVVFVAFTILGCKNKNDSQVEILTANQIIDKSIEVSGGEKFGNSDIGFKFRDKSYAAKRNNGDFLLLRAAVENSNDSIFDVLTNDGFRRFINDEVAVLEDSIASNYTASVNSVHYFSVLPYGLNDKAVKKELIGEERIDNHAYHKIKVTFSETGGGEDYEDEFIYWINQETFKLEYLAYSYNESDGKGMRFRKAYNERYINGLRFVDYNNYKTEDKSVSLTEMGKAFEADKLTLLSTIQLNDVTVDLLNN
ncbi:DUF6503 family protein [Winogradskyella ursingii]|uniref:DUF6503 family protein n=1 Tax=Winogradskyella ursingii TaxID=2686079 RepID=UPI0015C6D2A6|nr:DUF6503 family protein [Winogradskyella ursingii]